MRGGGEEYREENGTGAKVTTVRRRK